MNNLKQRLARADGMNARLCHQAKDEIMRLEAVLQACYWTAKPDDETGDIADAEWMSQRILEITTKFKTSRWKNESA